MSYTGLGVGMGYTDSQRWSVGITVDCRGLEVWRREHCEIRGPRSREQGVPLSGITKEASPMGQNKRVSHGALTGKVVQRGLRLTPLLLMTSFKQQLIGELRRGQAGPD